MTTTTRIPTNNVVNRPKVSVVMSIHNEEEYGPTAIQSILDQSFPDFEFIIIDDASTDSTPVMLREFADRDRRIRILTNAENIMVPRSLNRGLQIAQGEYIARMDSDDFSFPQRFKQQVTFLDLNPDFIVVGGGVEYINAEGAALRLFDRGSTKWEFDWVSCFRSPLAHPSAMFRSGPVKSNNLFYDDAFNGAADFEFWHRMLRFGGGCELSGALIKYRIHDRNVSKLYSHKQIDSARRAAIKNAALRFPEISSEAVSNVFRFLYPADSQSAFSLTRAIQTVEQMQSIHAENENLSRTQINDITRKTAKLLIRNALNRGLHKRYETAASVALLIAQYFPDYFAESLRILRHRSPLKIAA